MTIGAITGSLLLLSAAGLYALMAFTVAQKVIGVVMTSSPGPMPNAVSARPSSVSSTSSTRRDGSALSRLASTQPAEPAPTTM